MAVKIRLKRMGKIRQPHYRIVVIDGRAKRDGRPIEEIGTYNPMTNPSTIKVESERAQYWLGVGAQPSDRVLSILKLTGDWQKFKGIEGQEGSVKYPDPKPEFVAPDKGSVILPEATTPKKSKADAEEAPAEEAAEAAEEPAETEEA